MIKIIYLIKDEERTYNSNYTYIKVTDLSSYLESRKFYEHNKFLNNNYEIVVQNNRYFDYYLDIETEDSNVKTKNLSNTDYIYEEFPEKNLTEYSLEFIKKYKILDKKESFLIDYQEQLDFDENIIFFLLNIVQEDFENLYCLLGKLNSKKEFVLYDSNLFSIFKKVFFKQSHSKDDLELVEVILKEYSQESWDYLIFQSLILTSYSKRDYIILNSFDKLNNYYDFLSQRKNTINLELDVVFPFLNKINMLIRNRYRELEIYNKEFNLTEYLNKITGFLDFELEYLALNYIELISNSFNIDLKEDFFKIKEKFLSKSDFFKEKIEALEEFSCLYLKILNLEKDYDTIYKWKEFFVEDYTKLSNTLKKDSIYDSLKKVEILFKLDLVNINEIISKRISLIQKNFSNYILNHYDNLVSSENKMGLDYCLEDINKYIESNTKTILFFIDCLRYDIYIELKNHLYSKGYISRVEDDIRIAPLPTVTQYGKNTLLSGTKYNTLILNPLSSEEEMIENALYSSNVDRIEDFIEIQESNSDFIFYKTTDIDYFMHNIKDLDMESIKPQLIKKIDAFISNMDNRKSYNIVLMTDHGSVNINNMSVKPLNNDTKNFLKANNLSLDSHGRYLKIHSESYNEKLYEELKKHLIEEYQNFYHILNRENLIDFYLPKFEKNQENYFYLISKESYLPSYSKGKYTHGGLSLEEIFVPFQIFSKVVKSDDKGIEIKLDNTSNITSKKESYLKVEIFNKNKFSINNLNIKLKNNGKEIYLEELKANITETVEIPLFYEEIGNIKDVLEIKYNFSGKESIKIKEVDIKVKENKKDVLNKKLKSSRTLL